MVKRAFLTSLHLTTVENYGKMDVFAKVDLVE